MKELLLEIQGKLSNAKRSRSEILQEALITRLDKSLELYREYVEEKGRFLSQQNELQLLKTLRK